ncbi:MAG: GTP-binding protein [Gammaproteobacteria bacterium SG8_47]|nr:MAG: GTP-binding protein [Gammaproteobacteria bacterium SG8_47]
MKQPDLSHTRNVGIVAHVDAGKTTLTERVLYYTGALHKIGEVHDGAAHMDYLDEERAHGITITAAVTKAPWADHLIQLVDTPGHVDFTIEVERAMRVLDGCVVVLDGVRGVEPQTETVWHQRQRFGIPALFFINKMDRPGADFDHALASIRKRLNAEPAPVTVPVPEQHAVVHLIERSLIRFEGEQGERVVQEPCGDEQWAELQPLRESLALAAAEADDELAELVLTGEEVPADLLWRGLREATLSGACFPCFGGSALRNQGVQPLLDAIPRLLPSPLDRPPSMARDLDGQRIEVDMDAKGPLAALAFKVQLWDGRRHVFARLYRGTLSPGDKVVTPTAEGKLREEQVARVFDVDANKRSRLDMAFAGQIVLLAGLRHASTGDTLCDPRAPLLLERIEAREPVISLAIEPSASDEEDKLLEVLDKLQQEDPTLSVEDDPETGQRLLRGMGELHLQIVLERLEREFHLRVRAGRPRVALRETIKSAATAELVFDRVIEVDRVPTPVQARAVVTVRPLPRRAGVQVRDDPVLEPEGASLSATQREAVSAAARDLLASGPEHGLPLQDLAIEITRIELFGQASRPEALRACVALAVRKALLDAEPLVLHPIMRTEVVVPEENLGTVLGDLQSRQANIVATQTLGDTASVTCDAPLDNLLGYTTVLRSLTHGRGQFTMMFERFDTL